MNAMTRRLKDGFTINNRYQIEELLGIQDIGHLYICRDQASGRSRARLRILQKDRLGSEGPCSLSNGLSLLRRLQHPNLGRVLDFGIVDKSTDLFVVQEWVEGKDIWAGTEGVDLEELIGLLIYLVKSLHYLHTRGLVHGCLNSSNIILAQNGNGKTPKMVDFSLVRCLPRISSAGRLGNSAYIAPELLLGGVVTQSSDLYSLGILIYQLLTRRLPFDDADPGFLLEKHLQVNVDLRPVRRLKNGAVLKEMLCGLLERNVSKRTASCEGVLRSLVELAGSDVCRKEVKDLGNLFSASRFVGREKEHSLLRNCATRVLGSGRGWTIFVVGEGGLGKSRLLEEFSDWALLEGWRVIEGSCDTQHQEPYGPYRQILGRTESASGESIFRFDDLPRSTEPGSFESSPEFAAGQFRDLLTRELVRRLSDCPTLLLLHDFHLSDEATSTVLDYLSSDIQTHPILMCVSQRSGEESKGVLNRLMEQVVRQQRGEVLDLAPLTEANVGELIAGIAGDSRLGNMLRAWMYASIGGNPFFIEEMLKHLVEQGLLRYDVDRFLIRSRDLQKLEVPETIGAVLQRRLVQLSPASAKLANWLALFHRPVARDLLRNVMEWEDVDFAKALQELRERQLIRIEKREAVEIVELCHTLIAEVIRGQVPRVQRRRMHRRIAEVLEQECGTNGNLQELTMHSMEGQTGVKAARYALALAKQSHAEFAHEKALQCYEYVFENRGDLTDAELCQAAIEASDTMRTSGQPRNAIRLIQSVIRTKAITATFRPRMYMALAFCHHHLGNTRLQETCCNKGLKLLRNVKLIASDATKCRFWAELAFGAILQSRIGRGLGFLNKALKTCPDPDTGVLAGRIYTLSASLHRVACNLHGALAAAEKAAAILIECDESYLKCSAQSTLGSILAALGRFTLAESKHQLAVLLGEQSRSIILRSQALGNMAECLCRMGRVQEAIDVANEAAECVAGCNSPAIVYAFNTILAEIKLAACDYKASMEIIDRLQKNTNPNLALYASGHALYIAANLSFLVGDFDNSLKNIEKLLSGENREIHFYEKELAWALRARILFERGQFQKAISCLYSLERKTTKKRWPYHMCLIKLHLAGLLLRNKVLIQAEKKAKDALRLAKAMKSQSLIGQAYLILGSIYSTYPSANRKGVGLEMAIENLRNAINDSIPNETAFRAHAALSIIYKRQSDISRSIDHAEKAYGHVCKLEAQVPTEMLSLYRSSLERFRLKSEIIQVLQDAIDLKPMNSIEAAGLQTSQDSSRVLLRVSTAVISAQDISQLLEGILDQLIQVAGLERAFAMLLDESTGKLHPAKGRNHLQANVQEVDLLSGSVVTEVFESGMPLVSTNAQIDPRLVGRVSLPGNPGLILCAPLKVSERILGVLYADHSSPAENLSESVINLFAAFCNLAAIAIDNAIAHRQLAREKSELEQYLHQARDEYPEIVGKSAVIEALRDRIGLAAGSPLDIVIIGESGTGKELVARAIHRSGKRRSGKFVPVDCGSLTDTLAEAELFGYRKGSFTGAIENRPGLLESAHGGILFLDEISNLPLRTQPKLLRVLQEREVRRIGETITRKIDFQVVSATNREILQDVREGRFRNDLYHRIRGMEIRVPALRERPDDISLLLEWYLSLTAKVGGRVKKFSPEAKGMLQKYHYPGNIRELKNIVAEAYYSAEQSQITVDNLPAEVREMPTDGLSVESGIAARLYTMLNEGRGTFEELVKNPFIDRQLAPQVVRGIVEKALRDSGGSYRRAFSILRIPERQYSLTIRFLKKYNCYINYQLFRKRHAD